MPNDFSRDLVRESAPDRSGHDDSEHSGSEPFHPTLTASVTLVRSVPRFMVFSRMLTAPYQIQDSACVAHGADGSRSLDLQRHHSVQHGPGRGPARDIFHSFLTHRGATEGEHEWHPPVDNPDPVRTPGPVQRDPSHGLTSVPYLDSIYNLSVPDGPLPNVGGITPLANTEFLSWSQGVYARDSFTSYRNPVYPNPVSGETVFPQNRGPLIQSSYYAARPVFTVEHPQSNRFQLSSSGSQESPLIINPNYVRSEISARWRCLTFDFLIIHRHSIQHSQTSHTIVTPLSLKQCR